MVQGQEKQDKIRVFPLSELIPEDNSEEDIQRLTELLSSFSCESDKDIELFLHKRAIGFECLNKSRTYLLCDDNILRKEERFAILGYFTIALKVLDLPEDLSNKKRKKLDGVSAKLHGNVIKSVPCYLIGQLAKNSAIPKEQSIKGSDLIDYAISVIRSAEALVGGRYVLVECHDNPKLLKFYTDNGFTTFGKIPFENMPMVQMLRTLCRMVPE